MSGRAGAGRWAPTHQHRKGGLYRVLSTGIAEADRSPVVIYDDPEGTVWVRAAAEFHDGRFTPVAPWGRLARLRRAVGRPPD